MNIVVLNWRDPRSPQAGGAEVHLHEVFRRAVQRGDDVLFITTRYRRLSRHDRIDGVCVLRVGNPFVTNFAIPLAARAECRRRRVDVVVDCVNKVPFFAPAYVRVPVAAIVHHLPGASAFREVAFPAAAAVCLYEQLIPFVYKRTPIITISASSRDELVARGLDARRIAVIDLGVDHDTYRLNGQATVPAEPLILHVGRVRRYKQIDHAIRMIGEVRKVVPSARLAIVGEGKDEPRLRQLASRLGLDEAVEFAGYVSEDEKVRWIRRASLLACTSVKEGWGLTVVEAGACAVPVIAYDVPGLRDSVRSGTGKLVPSGDVRALAKEAVAFLTDEALRERCAQQARAWALRFSWDRCARETLEALERVAAPGRTCDPT